MWRGCLVGNCLCCFFCSLVHGLGLRLIACVLCFRRLSRTAGYCGHLRFCRFVPLAATQHVCCHRSNEARSTSSLVQRERKRKRQAERDQNLSARKQQALLNKLFSTSSSFYLPPVLTNQSCVAVQLQKTSTTLLNSCQAFQDLVAQRFGALSSCCCRSLFKALLEVFCFSGSTTSYFGCRIQSFTTLSTSCSQLMCKSYILRVQFWFSNSSYWVLIFFLVFFPPLLPSRLCSIQMYPAAAASSVKSWSFVRRASYMSSSFCLHACLISWYTSHGGILNRPWGSVSTRRERERENSDVQAGNYFGGFCTISSFNCRRSFSRLLVQGLASFPYTAPYDLQFTCIVPELAAGIIQVRQTSARHCCFIPTLVLVGFCIQKSFSYNIGLLQSKKLANQAQMKKKQT